MAFELQKCRPGIIQKIKSPELRDAFAQGLAMFYYQDLAATAVACHAAVQEGAALAFPGPFTDPATPRSLSIAFAAGWQGGDVTIIGLDQFNRVITETIADVAGTTVQGTKVFKSITSASKELIAGTTDTCTLQTGTIIGLPLPMLYAWGIGLVTGVAEAFTWNATVHGFTPTTSPNGTLDFTVLIPVDWALARSLSL